MMENQTMGREGGKVYALNHETCIVQTNKKRAS
jgi:hypothetical protein